jgi:hypothetical protein
MKLIGFVHPKKNSAKVYLIPPDQKERQSFHSFNCCTVDTCAEFNPKTPTKNIFTNLTEQEKEKVLQTRSLKKPLERLNGRNNFKHELSDHNVTFCNNVKCGVDAHGHKTVNHYVILKHVGQGTHGNVFLCFDSVTRKNMAIKILKKSVLKRIRSGVRGNNNELNKVLKSIAIMKKLNHENVIKLLEVIDDPTQDKMFEVFEYASKGQLLKLNPDGTTVDGKKFDENTARIYFIKLIKGLAYCK